MNTSKKLQLENMIFARAAQTGAAVDAARGGLVSPSEDDVLQVLIFYYNVFFRLPCDPGACGREPYALFLQTRPRRAPFKFAGVVLLARDLPAELWYEKQN